MRCWFQVFAFVAGALGMLGGVSAQVVTITAPTATATEAGLYPGLFQIQRSGDTSGNLTVKLAVGGNATAGVDYETLPDSVVIPAGTATIDVPLIPINEPTVEAGTDAVTVTVAPDAAYTVGTPASASVSIVSDETFTNICPFLIEVTPVSSTSVVLRWTDNFETEAKYRIQRAPAGTSSWTSVDVPANTTTAQINNLTAGQALDFRVVAVPGGSGTPTSATSNVVRQTMVAPTSPPPAYRTFEEWRDASGLSGALRPMAGTNDDPDRDGKLNFVEYLLGSDPLQGDTSGLTVNATGAGGSVGLRWPASNPDLLDASLVLEETTSLSSNWISSPLVATAAGGNQTTADVRTGAMRFYRLAPRTTSPVAPSAIITCWGDSLTGNPGTYAEKLRTGTVLGNRTVQNCGIGGDISAQIADRLVGATVSEPFPAISGNAPALTRVMASRPLHGRVMNSASYRGQWPTYAATFANVTKVEFFNLGRKIGESSTPLTATVTVNRTVSASRLVAPGHPFEDGMIVHFPAGPLPSPLVVGKTYLVRDRDANGFALVEGDTIVTITANTTSPSGRFVAAGHPYANGDRVSFAFGASPSGMISDTPYYVRDADSAGFSVAPTPGGNAVTTQYAFTGPVRGKPALTPVSLTANFTAPTVIQGPFVLNWSFPGGPLALTLRTHTDRDANTFIFWMGRNNNTRPHETYAHLRAAVRQIKALNGRFLILSVTNGGNESAGSPYYYGTINLNAVLKAEYPNEFVDIRSLLVRSASSSTQDQTDRAADIPPTSLRSDAVHFNDAGQQIIANAVAAELARRGW